MSKLSALKIRAVRFGHNGQKYKMLNACDTLKMAIGTFLGTIIAMLIYKK